MTQEERVILEARNLLSVKHDKESAARKLTGQGVSYAEAKEIVTEIYRSNQAYNRKSAFVKFILAGLGFAACILILIVAHRIFYILLITSAASCIWGLAQFIGASGYDVDSSD